MSLKEISHRTLRRGRPIRMSDFGTIRREYDISLRKKKRYEKVRWASEKGMMNRFKLAYKLLSGVKYDSLLDIGCGTGDIFKVINDARKRYFAYDLNLNMVSYAKNNTNKNVRYFNASSRPIPVKSDSVDVVTVIGVLQNCGMQIGEFIKEISRVVKKNGYLFLITKNLGWYKFKEGDLKPEKQHNWFFDYEISGKLADNGFNILLKSGFLNRSGKWVDIEKSHEIFYWAQKRNTQKEINL